MIISHKYKFIFIKTEKTAGTSIEIYLSQFCGCGDIFTPIYPHVEPHQARNFRGLWNPFPEMIETRLANPRRLLSDLSKRRRFYNHIPALRVKNRIAPSIWSSYFKFCVERNPWEKTLSHYFMKKDRSGGLLSMDDYFRQGQFCINYPKYLDAHNRLLVDRVLYYESLTEELGGVFAQLGVPFSGSLGVRAKSGYPTKSSKYREIFTQQQRAVIEKVFQTEIAMHGYVF